MLTKRNLGRGKVRVTFSSERLEDVKQLFLVGDFNNWSVTETPLTRAPDGTWSVALTLDSGRRYEYRFFADNQVWHTDWTADASVANSFGSHNSVVNLEEEAPTPAAAPKKARTPHKKSSRA